MAQRRPAADAFAEQYGVLLDNNIFRRDRSRPAPQPRPEQTNPPPNPQQSFMLTGIVFEEGDFRAYFETAGTPPIIRVIRGQKLAGGVVMDIAFDAVAFETGGMARWIEIGQDLTGATADLPTARGTTELVEPSPAAPDRVRLMEEQMRQRRRPGRN